MKTGWCKSSGFTGSGGKFALTPSAYKLKINIDWTTYSGSGTDQGDGFYIIELNYNGDGTPISGEVIAADMKDKIRALTLDSYDVGLGLSLSYLNASVEYKNGRFFITSGSGTETTAGGSTGFLETGSVGATGITSGFGFSSRTSPFTISTAVQCAFKKAVNSLSRLSLYSWNSFF